MISMTFARSLTDFAIAPTVSSNSDVAHTPSVETFPRVVLTAYKAALVGLEE